MKQRLYINVCIVSGVRRRRCTERKVPWTHKERCQCSRKGLLRQKYAGLRRGRIKRPFNKISLMCTTDPFVPHRIHLAETEIAHTPQMGCTESEETPRTEFLAQNFCRKKQIPADGYSCSLHKWFVLHGTHSSAQLQFLSAYFRTAACSFPRSNHSSPSPMDNPPGWAHWEISHPG